MARSKVWTGSVWAYEDDVVSSENTFKPVIDVTAPVGTSITVSNGSIGFTRTSTETITRFDIPSWGTWTASATIYGNTVSNRITIDTVKIYETSLQHLPTGYQEVEWIASSGTQFIDTLFNPNQNTRVEMNVIGATAAETIFFGAWNESYNNGAYAFGYDISGTYCGYDGQGGTNPGRTTGDLAIDFNRNVVSVNNTTARTFAAATFQVNYPLYLFAQNRKGTAYKSPTAIKLASCRIYDDGTLARDFVPCYRTSDNVIGLYDLKNDAFYTNAGTGSFTKGGNV